MIGLLRRIVWNPLSFIVIRLFGRSLDGVSLSIAICTISYFSLFFHFHRLIPNIHYPIILIFFIDVLYLTRAVWWNLRVGKNQVLGYLRLDNTIEIHITGMESAVVFEKNQKDNALCSKTQSLN